MNKDKMDAQVLWRNASPKERRRFLDMCYPDQNRTPTSQQRDFQRREGRKRQRMLEMNELREFAGREFVPKPR